VPGLFHQVLQTLGIRIRPSQGRHSGASVDRALNLKTQDEVVQHGRWKKRASAMRYEKKGFLNQHWLSLSLAARRYCDACEMGLANAILYGDFPVRVAGLGSGSVPNTFAREKRAQASTDIAHSAEANTSSSMEVVPRKLQRRTLLASDLLQPASSRLHNRGMLESESL
jgi:hypothetical protein